MTTFNLIGKRIPKLDAVEKVTGRLRYVADLRMAGMLYGKLVHSPYPHARILKIDTSAAEQLPGVMAVITGKDMPQTRYGHLVKDLSFLPLDKVRYFGEPVAAVAAMDEATAEQAAELVQVEYEELPVVGEAEEAIQPGAPLIHEDLAKYETRPITADSPLPLGNVMPGTNIFYQLQLRSGDVQKGFRESDRIFEETYRVPMVSHAAMEPHACIAEVAPNGYITVWTCTQGVSRMQHWIAELFGLSDNMVRVIGMKPGGGFGGKIGMTLEPYCIALSKKAGRPVRIVMTRDETFHMIGGWLPGVFKFKTGVTKDGRLLARQVEILWNGGAHSYTSPVASALASLVSLGPYKTPHVSLDSKLVYTNRPGARPWRGLAATQGNWAAERHIDEIARQLGVDPLEFRLKNCLEPGDPTPWGEVPTDVCIKECLQAAAEAIGWGKAKEKANSGKGIASLWKWTVPGFVSQALVKVLEDGSAEVISGTPDIGTGSEVVMAQIAGEVLGLPVNRIRVYMADTASGLLDYGASASRSASYSGSAVLRAALDVRDQNLHLASRELEIPVEELEMVDQRVQQKGKPDRNIPISKLLAGRGTLVGKGEFRGQVHTKLAEGVKTGWRFADWKFGAAAAEVEVDPETGKAQVERVVMVHDIGRIINRLNVESQAHGSAVMAIGATMYEHMMYDGARMVNPTFMEYIMPTALEAPRKMIPIFLEPATGHGPFGAKGFGELPVVAVGSAVGNAIADAVGAQVRDLPMTPEKVLKALEKKV
ncbi:MAG: xanthine dehydrogenase family protein molybdopterin-binding subunit [Chloroflexi bacterium]|nr:xanthine dehydrogenase family protein molybdopterin-binding subunit [Chloroflexota bacterium]